MTEHMKLHILKTHHFWNNKSEKSLFFLDFFCEKGYTNADEKEICQIF